MTIDMCLIKQILVIDDLPKRKTFRQKPNVWNMSKDINQTKSISLHDYLETGPVAYVISYL